MKKIASLLTLIIAFSLSISDLDARGGRGGGRGGGSRGGGGGRSIQRSPSMSRSTPRTTSRPTPKPRQTTTSRPQRKAAPSMGTRASQGQRSLNKTQARSDVQNFLKTSSVPSTSRGNVRGPQDRPTGSRNVFPGGQRAQKRQDQPISNRRNLGQNVRDEVARTRPNRSNWFNDSFWARHAYRPPYYRPYYNGWRWATAAGLSGWLGWSGIAPNYYDYGMDNGTWDSSYASGTDETYSQKAEALASTSTPTTQDEWMSLGVFALSKEDKASTTTPNIYLQLALNKEGILSGTYYNTTTDQAHEVEGVVDAKSQRAAWKVVDNETSPILETGVYNLTQGEVPVLAHFENGIIQEVVLVRLEEP